MSEHSLPLPDLHEHKLPNESFWGWIKTQTALFYSQIAVFVSIILYISMFVYYVFGKHVAEDDDLSALLDKVGAFVAYANIAVCFLFTIITVLMLHKNKYGKHQVELFYKRFFFDKNDLDKCKDKIQRAENRLYQFKKIFLFYWIVAIAYYFFRTIFSRYLNTDKIVSNVLDFFFNNMGLTIIYACYKLFTKPIEQTFSVTFVRGISVLYINFLIAFIVYILLLLPTPVLEMETKMKLSLAFSGVVFMISFSLLTFALDNKIIGLSSVLISVLFGYASIQPLEFAFDYPNDISYKIIDVTTVVLAFIFKIYFFSIISFASQTGRLLNFLTSKSALESKFEKNRL